MLCSFMVINLDVPTLIYLPKLIKNLCHINFPHVATSDCVTCGIFLQDIIICDESGKVLWHMNTATENARSDLVATEKLQKSWNRHMTRYRMQYSATSCCRAIIQSYKIGSNAQALTLMLYCYHDSLLSWCGQYTVTLSTVVSKLKNAIKESYHSYGISHMITRPWSLDRCRLKAYQRHELKNLHQNYMFI